MVPLDEHDPTVQPTDKFRKFGHCAIVGNRHTVVEIADVQHQVALSDDTVPERDVPLLVLLGASSMNGVVLPRTKMMVACHERVVEVKHAFLSHSAW